jgi:hypothetical protein
MSHSEIIARAREEWERKTGDRDWRGWMRIGDGLEIGRDEIDKRLHNRKGVPGGGSKGRNKGRRWNEEFGAWLSENGMGELGGKKFAAVRSHLMDCVDHKTEIEEWRRTLSLQERTAWNHPTTVWRQFNKHLAAEAEDARIATGGEEPPKKPSPMAEMKEALRNLVDENDRLRKAPREGDLFKWGEEPKRIARVIVTDAIQSGCSPDKVGKILRAALAELEGLQGIAEKVKRRPRAKKSPITPNAKAAAEALAENAAFFSAEPQAKKSAAAPGGEDDATTAKLQAVLTAAGDAGLSMPEIYNKTALYESTVRRAVERVLIRQEGKRYYASA